MKIYNTVMKSKQDKQNENVEGTIEETEKQLKSVPDSGYATNNSNTKSDMLESHLQIHAANEKHFQYAKCDSCFFRNSNLKRHLMACHNSQRQNTKTFEGRNKESEQFCKIKVQSITHNGEKSFECSQCGKKLCSNRSLVRHSKLHKPNSNLEMPSIKNASQGFNKSTIDKKEMVPKQIVTKSKTKFRCEYCDKIVRKRWDLKMHKRIHTGETPFECSMCNKKYPRRHSLVVHMKSHEKVPENKSTSTFSCKYCNKIFKRHWDYKMHKRIHTGETPFECSLCNRKYPRKHSLAKHMKLHERQTNVNQENKFKCEEWNIKSICLDSLIFHRKKKHKDKKPTSKKTIFSNRQFANKSSLVKHSTKHRPKEIKTLVKRKISYSERRFTCDVCKKKFLKVQHLTCHMRIHTGEKPYECSQCPEKFSRKDKLDRHFKIHEPYGTPELQDPNNVKVKQFSNKFVCQICHKTIGGEMLFQIHMNIHTRENLLNCPKCDKQFARNCNLVQHLKFHSNQELKETQNVKKCVNKSTIDKKKELEATQNVKKCVTKSTIAKKKVKIKVSSSERRFKCDFCNNKFFQRHHLKSHIRTQHTGEKPYKSLQCLQKFTPKQNLNRHYKMHELNGTPAPNGSETKTSNHIRNKFICQICNKSIAGERSFQIHTNIHTREHLLDCSKCDMKFARNCNLVQHLKFHSKQDSSETTSNKSKTLQEKSTDEDNIINVEMFDLTRKIKTEIEEDVVIEETEYTIEPYNKYSYGVICKEELIISD